MHQLRLVAASVDQCFDARSAGPAPNRQIFRFAMLLSPCDLA